MEGWKSIQGFILDDLITYSENINKVADVLQWIVKSIDIQQKNRETLFDKLNNSLRSNPSQIKYKGLILVKATFDSKSITAYSLIKLRIILTSCLPFILNPIKISLVFSDPLFNTDNIETISLLPNESNIITHSLIIRSPTMTNLQLLKVIARYEPIEQSWIDFEIDTKAKLIISSPPPQLSPTFNHLPPALIGENYILNIDLHAYSEISLVKMTIYEEEREIGQRRRAASIDRDFDNNFCIFDIKGNPIDDGIIIPEVISPMSIPLKIIFYEEKSYNLKAKFSYSVHKPYDIIYKSDDVYDLDITVQPPFQFKMKWSKFIEVNSQAVMNVKIWNICNSPIFLTKILLIPETGWHCNDTKLYPKLEINEGNMISEDFIINTNTETPCTLLGNLLVTWSRNEGIFNDCRIPIPPIVSQCHPIDLIVKVGSEFRIKEVFEMIATVINKTKTILEAKLLLDESTSFLMGGVENIKFELKEESEKSFKFSLVAFENGLIELPKVTVKLTDNQRIWQRKILILP